MAKNSGTNVPRSAKSPTLRARRVYDLIEDRSTVVKDSKDIAPSSGGLFSSFLSGSLPSLGGDIIRRMEWVQGSFLFPLCVVLLLTHLSLRTIRLPGDGGYRGASNNFSEGGLADTIASIPWFLVGVGSVAWEWVVSNVENLSDSYRGNRGFRHLPVDEDAQILRFQDED